MAKLPSSFYRRVDTLQIARDLLGMRLFSNVGGVLTAGEIVETEAYLGVDDRACHAWNGRRTNRTEVMFQAGGLAYVYLIYGMYDMFNVVTNVEGKPHAILVRAVAPVVGIEAMLQRRNFDLLKRGLTSGPGKLAQAMGISRAHTGLSLTGDVIWIEDAERPLASAKVLASPRVGIDYAGEDALLPYRFRIAGSKWTSPARS